MSKAIILALSSALLLILSFPSFNIDFLAWFALVPLFISIRDKSLKSTFALSLITGIIFFMGIFYWVNAVGGVTWLDYIVTMLFLGLYFGLFGLIFRFISSKKILPSVITAPAFWVSIEYLRSHAGFLSMPWALLAHSQYVNLPVIQISSFSGAYGVSFLIIMVNAAFAEFIYSRFKTFKPILITLLILIISFAYGISIVPKNTEGKTVPVTVIQGNISMDKKLDLEYQKYIIEKQIRLTKEAIKHSGTALVVWPEGSVRGVMGKNSVLSQYISALSKETNVPVLVGSSRRPKIGQKGYEIENYEIKDLINLKAGEKVYLKHKFHNSAFYFSPRGELLGQYNKIRLLPFAEYIPHEDTFPWPSHYTKTDNFIPGNEYTIFSLNGTSFGVLICWENIFSDLFRQFLKKGAQFMINITNESWFGNTSAPYEFLSMSVFRAVENRVSIARAANTGISCYIDPHGRIIGKILNNEKDIFVEGYLTKEIPISQGKTFYTQYGEIFAYICILISIFILVLSFFKIKR